MHLLQQPTTDIFVVFRTCKPSSHPSLSQLRRKMNQLCWSKATSPGWIGEEIFNLKQACRTKLLYVHRVPALFVLLLLVVSLFWRDELAGSGSRYHLYLLFFYFYIFSVLLQCFFLSAVVIREEEKRRSNCPKVIQSRPQNGLGWRAIKRQAGCLLLLLLLLSL